MTLCHIAEKQGLWFYKRWNLGSPCVCCTTCVYTVYQMYWSPFPALLSSSFSILTYDVIVLSKYVKHQCRYEEGGTLSEEQVWRVHLSSLSWLLAQTLWETYVKQEVMNCKALPFGATGSVPSAKLRYVITYNSDFLWAGNSRRLNRLPSRWYLM